MESDGWIPRRPYSKSTCGDEFLEYPILSQVIDRAFKDISRMDDEEGGMWGGQFPVV